MPERIEVSEGFRRIRIVAWILMTLGASAGLLTWISVSTIAGRQLGLVELGWLAVLPLLIGSVVFLLVWVSEGFVSRSRRASR